RQEAQLREQAERWERYRANLVASASAFQVFSVGSARHTLEAAPEEYRDWEWRHFHSRLDLAQHVLGPAGSQAGDGWVAPDGRHAVLFGDRPAVRVWDTTAQRAVNVPGAPADWGRPRLSPDGRTLAYVIGANTIILRDLATGRDRAALRGHDRRIHTLYFS